MIKKKVMILRSFTVCCILWSMACQQSTEVESPPPSLPFSQSIEVGDLLYLSGQVGLNPTTKELASGIEAETKVTMENLDRELKAKGYGFSDVVATHVWMTDLSKIGEMSQVYRSFFKSKNLPTRTTVGISKLAIGASIEIAMVAMRGEKKAIYPPEIKPDEWKLPFTPGILCGDYLFVSGQAGTSGGKLVEGDIKVQVSQTLTNIENILKAGDMDFSNVVSTEVFMSSGEFFGPMSEVYVSKVPDPKPARVPILVSNIPLNSPVEITMIASRKQKEPVLPEGMPPSGAYSRGLKVGNAIYIAGVFSGKETVADRVNDCLGRVKQILEAGDFSLKNVVEVRVYLSDMADYAEMNNAYRSYFPESPPTRATLGVAELPGTNKIGMQFVAVKKGD